MNDGLTHPIPATERGTARWRRIATAVVVAATMGVAVSVSAAALVARLTRIPLGRGTATITWTGATGIRPTINSIRGTAGGYQVSASGKVPQPAFRSEASNGSTGTSISIPSVIPLADVKGSIGGTPFTLHIALTLPSSLTPSQPQRIGRVSGTFRGQPITATLTATSDSFRFNGTIGTLQVTGVVSHVDQHGNTETAHATFDITK
jgi:hypothetical protein